MIKYVIELADEEIKIVTEKELQDMQKSAEEYDGFESWIVRGKLEDHLNFHEKKK